MSRATASPVLRTESEQVAHEAACSGPLALAQSLWGGRQLALIALVAGIFSAVLALGAGGAAHGVAGPQPHSGSREFAAVAGASIELTETIAAIGENPIELGRGAPPDFGEQFKAAEFEQEDEEEQTKGVAESGASTVVPKFSRTNDERFASAAYAFVSRIGDFRELPRGPPSLC